MTLSADVRLDYRSWTV